MTPLVETGRHQLSKSICQTCVKKKENTQNDDAFSSREQTRPVFSSEPLRPLSGRFCFEPASCDVVEPQSADGAKTLEKTTLFGLYSSQRVKPVLVPA
ncbi:hypothetical protein EYF80_010556 [Liparis tanakae]|uniref:Uncharacterized protein n=1 Tax=Liparis tanakae TaxID=230148 RepID=A0A4Z2INF0_9TELE|nr:hypothetical protein EYF80_010556 [Liparis tanakae]